MYDKIIEANKSFIDETWAKLDKKLSKVAIRSIRRDANDKLKAMKKNSELPEDTISDLEEKVQKLTDNFCKEIDSIAAAKVKEIMEV